MNQNQINAITSIFKGATLRLIMADEKLRCYIDSESSNKLCEINADSVLLYTAGDELRMQCNICSERRACFNNPILVAENGNDEIMMTPEFENNFKKCTRERILALAPIDFVNGGLVFSVNIRRTVEDAFLRLKGYFNSYKTIWLFPQDEGTRFFVDGEKAPRSIFSDHTLALTLAGDQYAEFSQTGDGSFLLPNNTKAKIRDVILLTGSPTLGNADNICLPAKRITEIEGYILFFLSHVTGALSQTKLHEEYKQYIFKQHLPERLAIGITLFREKLNILEAKGYISLIKTKQGYTYKIREI